MTNKLLDSALDYASRGIHVFPTREKVGTPYLNDKGVEVTPQPKQPYSKPGIHGATIDKDEIIKMWTHNPNAAIGINCGLSNLFAIDIDTHNGSGGLENFMRMGISTKGAWQCLTPGGGIHFIFSGSGRTTTNEKLQIDTRGKNGYIIAPPSWIIVDGEKKHYTSLVEWKGLPAPIPPDAARRLGIARKRRGVPSQYNDQTPDEDLLARVQKAFPMLDANLAYDYSTWVRVGMSLYSLGLDGFELWEEWTDKYFDLKPQSKRIGTLENKWNTFEGTSVTIGTYFYYIKESNKNKRENGTRTVSQILYSNG